MSLGERFAALAGPVESQPEPSRGPEVSDGQSMYRDDRIPLLTSLPGMIPGTDPVKDERDIVYLVEIAMGEFGVRNQEELGAWLNHIQSLAFRSKMTDRTGLSPTMRESQVRTLARYLEDRARLLQHTHVT